MKKLLFLLLFIVSGGPAFGAVITFDHWPNGDPIASTPVSIHDEFASLGIIFDPGTTDIAGNNPDAISGLNLLANGGPHGFTLSAYFIEPGVPSQLATVPWVEITQDDGHEAGLNTLYAYDINDNLVDTFAINSSEAVLRVEHQPGIHRIALRGLDGMDDLTFSTPTPIPEPSTLALLSIGIVGFATLKRRRRHPIGQSM